jgi:uncharacterized protein (DUF2236 family)
MRSHPHRLLRLVAVVGLVASIQRGARADDGEAELDERARAAFRRIAVGPLKVTALQRALLLQLAHPKIAAGVAAHSHVAGAGEGGVDRFIRTARLGQALMLGTDEQADRAAAEINRAHDRIAGRVPQSGARYSAHDPQLQYWVMATTVDSLIVAHERLVAPLTLEEKDDLTRGLFRRVGLRLRIPAARLPSTYADVRRQLERGALELQVTPEARDLARRILWPAVTPELLARVPGTWRLRPWLLRSTSALGAASRFVALGLLPPPVAKAYDLGWSPSRARLFAGAAAASRGAARAASIVKRARSGGKAR